MLENSEITSEILSFERGHHFVSIDKVDNFIPRYRPTNIRYILFDCYLHFFMPFLFCVYVLFFKEPDISMIYSVYKE